MPGGCALDDKNKAACWLHPTEKYQLAGRAGWENGYPKKANAAIGAKQFRDVIGFDNFFCGVTADEKIDCFTPEGLSKIATTNLATLGDIYAVAANGNGQICAVTIGEKLSCYLLDVSASVAADDITASADVKHIAR